MSQKLKNITHAAMLADRAGNVDDVLGASGDRRQVGPVAQELHTAPGAAIRAVFNTEVRNL